MTAMERDLSYGRRRFGSALAVLEGRDPASLGGWRDTPNNRLRAAVLAVYECTIQHFPTRASYDAFTELLADVRDRQADGRILAAIEGLSQRRSAMFTDRLRAIARTVGSSALPSERFKSGPSDSSSHIA
jgi:hypothetical protein